MTEIDQNHARRFLLAWQGLLPLDPAVLAQAMPEPGPLTSALPPAGLTKAKQAIHDFIQRVGCIQYDPLNICGHNHELVLQARFRDFKPIQLQELLYQQRLLVDGMDKVMSIYPVADWPRLARRRAVDAAWADQRSAKALAILPQVLAEVANRGPLCSLDLDFHESVDWSWAPTRLARAALDNLYYSGELVVHHKVHTRKYYDLADRLIPPAIHGQPDPFASEDEYLDWHALRRIGGIGMLWNRGGDAWVGIPGWTAAKRSASLKRLLDSGELQQIKVQGIPHPFYLPQRAEAALMASAELPRAPARMKLLAPLDNLLWDRGLLTDLFGFDYRWEVYTPAMVRKYGYYILPVLYKDQLVARCEPLRERKDKALLIRNWWWEPGWDPEKLAKAKRESLLAARTSCLKDFAAFLGLEHVWVAEV